MAGPQQIDVPRGKLTLDSDGHVTLEFNPGFKSEINGRMSRAQKFVDSEVLRLDAPLMPIKTGFMIQSGTLGTEIGSGEVNYLAVYSDKQYYDTARTRSYDANRGSYWFERMKAANLNTIREGAKRIASGGSNV